MQHGNYEMALQQATALDRRNREDGSRLMALGEQALQNGYYEIAAKAFEYVKAKGPDNFHYIAAVGGMLRALKLQVTRGAIEKPSVDALVKAYDDALNELGKGAATAPLIVDLAHVKAFYQSRFDPQAVSQAEELLREGLKIPGLSKRNEAEMKLELGDVLILQNDIWEASILFGQVENDFKYDEIGFTAKLKNAMVFYYAGDFEWAEAKLRVLKGSTSKLIANDALELSAFIAENLSTDTTGEALKQFAKTELLMAQHKYDSALLVLNDIETNHPYHEISDDIMFRRAEIFRQQGRYNDAATTFEKLTTDFPNSILVDNALMEAASLYEHTLNQPERAMELYLKIISEHPSSLFVVEARKRYRSLRGDSL
ncbi:MAG: hypothetical protein Kow0075_15490 [Salibacteraceae bacterium]